MSDSVNDGCCTKPTLSTLTSPMECGLNALNKHDVYIIFNRFATTTIYDESKSFTFMRLFTSGNNVVATTTTQQFSGNEIQNKQKIYFIFCSCTFECRRLMNKYLPTGNFLSGLLHSTKTNSLWNIGYCSTVKSIDC